MKSETTRRRARPARAQVLTLGLALGLGLGGAGAGLLGCGNADESADPSVAAPELETDSPGLAAFIAEVRRAFEAGDAKGVKRLIHWDGMTPEAADYARRIWLPKGPSEVVAVRALAIPVGVLPPLPLEGVDYVSNLDVMGVLVLEIRDVSVGKIRVTLAFGQHEGRFALAGIKPKS
jgi:hypothetical protein